MNADDEQTLETIPCDQAILAVGQRLDARRVLGDVDVPLAGGWLQADPVTGQTAIPWLFAGGDAVSGPSSVVAAIGAGERAAVGMDALLTGATHAFWRTYPDVPTDFDPAADDPEVPDPYYGSAADFDAVVAMVQATVPGLRTYLSDR